MRVTFWSAYGSTALIVEHAGRKLCHVTHHPHDSAEADAALAAVAAAADLLIFPGSWQHGLALKQQAGATLLALAVAEGANGQAPEAAAEAAARKSPNVFFVRKKMSLDL